MTTPFDHISSCSRTADYTKPTATASRAAQVEVKIHELQKQEAWGDNSADLARALAAEVDARDETITKLLAMWLPEEIPEHFPDNIKRTMKRMNEDRSELYRLACEIAGRTE